MNPSLIIPESYQAVMPYLIIVHADQFFDFMHNVFGATQKMKVMRESSNMIMHAELVVDGSCIMYAEANDQWTQQNAGMFIYVRDVDACYRKALEAGATAVRTLEDMDYGRSGGVRDPFGNTWWITQSK